MAGSRKQYDMLFQLKATLGNNFISTFNNAANAMKNIQGGMSKINSLNKDISGYKKTQEAIQQNKNKLDLLNKEHDKLQSELPQSKKQLSDLKNDFQKQSTEIDKNKNKLQELKQQQEKTRTEIAKSGKATKEQKAELKLNEIEIKKTKEALKEQEEGLKQTTKQIDAAEKALGKKTKALSKNEKETKNLTAEMNREEQQLKEMSEELKRAGINTDNLDRSTAKLQKQYSKLQKSQENIGNINQQLENNRQAISKTKSSLIGTMGVITALGVAFYNGPIKTAAGFEKQMSAVKAISGATEEQFAELTKSAKYMGATTEWTAIQAGEAFEYMAMAGWKTGDMLNGIEGIMNLASASGEDLALTSDIVTDALTAFGMGAEGTNQFVDELAAASAAANTNVGLLGESFKYVAPLSGALKFSSADTAIALGLMANAGLKGSQSGTALRGAITNLVKPTDKMAAQMDRLGISVTNQDGSMKSLKEIMDMLRDKMKVMTTEQQEATMAMIAGGDTAKMAADAMKELSEEEIYFTTAKHLGKEAIKDYDIAQLRSALKTSYSKKEINKMTEEQMRNIIATEQGAIAMSGLTTAEQAQASATIFGKEAMSGLLSIINASEEDYNALTAAVYNSEGAAKEMAQIKLDNFEGQLTLCKSAIEGLQISLGDALLPTLTKFITRVSEVISKITEFTEKNPELTRTIAKVTFGLLGLKAGGLAVKLGFQEIKGGILVVKKVLEIFKGNSIAASIATETLGSKLFRMGGSVTGYFRNLGGAFSNIISSNVILTKVATVSKSIGRTISHGVLGGIGRVTGKIGSIFGKIGSVILGGPLGKIGSILGKGIGKIATVLSPVGNLFKVAFSPVLKLGSMLFGSFGGIIGKIFPIVGAITAVVVVIQLVRKNLDKIREFIGKVFGDKGVQIFDKVVNVIKNIGTAIQNVFSSGNIGTAVSKINQIFGKKGVIAFVKFIEVFKAIEKAGKGFVSFVTTHIVPIVEQVLKLIVKDVVPGIINGIKMAAPIVMQIIQTIAGFIGRLVPIIGSFVAAIMPVIGQIIEFIKNNVLPVIGEIFNFIVSTVFPIIASTIQNVADIVMSIISTVVPFVQNAIQTGWAFIQPILQAVLEVIQFIFPTIQEVVETVISTIGGVIEGLTTTLSGIITFITGVFSGDWEAAWNGVKDIFGGIFDTLKTLAKGAMNGIISAINVVIRGLNKVKIPEGIPGIGGMGIDIKEIPHFAKGTNRTPDTFVAGEKGPELITNAANKKVYTASQTKSIFDRASRQRNVTDSDTKTAPTIQSSKSGGVNITITNAPQINVDSGNSNAKEIQELLKQANEEFLVKAKSMIEQALAEAKEREARVAYD